MHKTHATAAMLCLASGLVATGAMARGEGGVAGEGIESLDTIRIASGLTLPLYVTHAPDDYNRIFVIEKTGAIKIININEDPPTVNATPFINLGPGGENVVGTSGSFNSEQGLLGLAFHPDYESNGFFYVNYTNLSGDTVVRRYTVSADPDIADATSELNILMIDQPFGNHNGGWMGFGPDGYLYINTGDGGSGCDPNGNGQSLFTLLGKVLRIDIDNDDFPADANTNYAVPDDNPFAQASGLDAIWHYGLRNPWRASFDRETGDFIIGDVGQLQIEEIDFQTAGVGGMNFGWRCMEGNSPSSVSGCNTAGCPAPDSFTAPIHTYTHAQGFSVTGGYVYRGCAIPSLRGQYFFADFGSAQIWTGEATASSMSNVVNRTSELAPGGGLTISAIASFGEDARGELYIVDHGGEVFKVVPTTPTIAAPDLNCDGVVNAADLALLLGAWNSDNNPADLNNDGDVNAADLALLLGGWG